MYSLNGKIPTKLEAISFSELDWKESDIEELLRQNVDMLCDDEDSMLIVGQQVQDVNHKRSDLTAIDMEGNIVLIEIKRDVQDILSRREPLEFQAIRYAASCATIKTTDELIQNIFAPYVEKHRSEFSEPQLTSSELAKRILADFMTQNNIADSVFNKRQRIILISSGFDSQTLSAVAWLNSNHVDISCFQLCPFKFGSDILVDMKRVLPLTVYEDYYVDIADPANPQKSIKKSGSKTSLPKIDQMLEWGVVQAGDVIIPKGRTEEATLLESGQVRTADGEMSMQAWLKGIYGWQSVQTYAFAVLKRTGETLSEIRAEYMKQETENASRDTEQE